MFLVPTECDHKHCYCYENGTFGNRSFEIQSDFWPFCEKNHLLSLVIVPLLLSRFTSERLTCSIMKSSVIKFDD